MSHKKVAHQPLDDGELEFLESLLYDLADTIDEQDVDARHPMMLDTIDGLFAALALTPRVTPISEWMSWVVGDAQFAEKSQTQSLRNLLIRHQNSVAYHFRKTDLSEYTPCISSVEDEDAFDVSSWCAGFTFGFEAKQALWAERMDESAWTGVHAIMALKETDETGQIVLSDDLDENELVLRQHQQTLVALMRKELYEELQEPIDNLALLLFVLVDLQLLMLASQAATCSTR